MDLRHLAIDLWERRRTLAMVLVGLLLADLCLSVVLFGVLMPGLKEQRALLAKRTAIVDASAQNQRPGVNMQAFYAQVPAYGTFPDFLKQLYQFSRSAGLRIDRITYRPEQTALRPVLRYTMDFSVKGSYRQIKTFLQSLESWQQLVVVEQVQLSAQYPERDEVVLSMRLAAYFSSVSS